MFRNVTPEKAIAITRLAVSVSYCWPLPPTTSKRQVLRFEIVRSALHANAFLLFFPLLYAIHVHRDRAENVCKAICLATALVQVLLQTRLYALHRTRFQRLIEEMNICCAKAKSHERQVLQRYVNKYSTFYALSAIWFYLTAAFMVLGTVVTPEPFPTNAEYPFPVMTQPLRSIVFAQQAFTAVQVASHVCVGLFCALMLLFAAARFEILMIELRLVKDNVALLRCLKKYHRLRRYAEEVADSFRSTVLIAVAACAAAITSSGIIFIGRQSFTVKMQFAFVGATALLEVFMYAWPADHLMDISENMMQGIYESTWFEQPIETQKSILLMLVPLSPVAVRISCIIPVFSLNYYCSFISNVFSLFTALRVVMLDDEEET